jgi:2-keto-3-deoxy-6-phosphogluconate aldolase
MGPLDRIPLVAVGGVHPGNIRDFWTAGASAALGGSFFRFDSRGAFDAKRLEEDILKIRELRRMHAGDAPACSGQAEA